MDIELAVKMLADIDQDAAEQTQRGLRMLVQRDPSFLSQLISYMPDMQPEAKARAYRVLPPIAEDDQQLISMAVKDIENADGALLRSALQTVTHLTPAVLSIRDALGRRLMDEDPDVIVYVIDAFRPAAHLPEVQQALSTFSDHPREGVRRVLASVLFDPYTLERAMGPQPAEEPAQAVALFVLPDETDRTDALDLIEEARAAVQGLAEFCVTDEQRENVPKVIEGDILPALAKLRELLAVPASSAGDLQSMRRESADIANRAGGLMRGVAAGVGNNAQRVLTVIQLGEKLWGLVSKLPP